MFNALFWPVLIFAGIDWTATWREWRRVRWITKPGTLVLLIGWFTWAGQWRGPLFFFGLGLCASLVGDILLMLPDRFFLGGLAAFLTAHLAYLVGFNQASLIQPWVLVPLTAAVLVSAALAFRPILTAVRRPENRPMLWPVLGYGSVISLMLLSALSSFWRQGWSPTAAGLASLGAGLFWISDRVLAGGKFTRPVSHIDLLVMTTYHVGQIGIAAGSLMAFS